jgi:hypothetical protein
MLANSLSKMTPDKGSIFSISFVTSSSGVWINYHRNVFHLSECSFHVMIVQLYLIAHLDSKKVLANFSKAKQHSLSQDRQVCNLKCENWTVGKC